MDISYLGQSSFKIKGKNATIITDPFDPKYVGIKYPVQEADIATVSHNHRDHNYIEAVKAKSEGMINRPFIVDGPGEYEIAGVNIRGITTYHDKTDGSERGTNTIYEIMIDGLIMLHLGDLGQKLTEKQCEMFDAIDILFVPVGGVYVIDPHEAMEVITQLEPKVVVPMHYKVAENTDLSFEKVLPLEEFLKEAGKTGLAPIDKLTISRDKLPEEMQIITLK